MEGLLEEIYPIHPVSHYGEHKLRSIVAMESIKIFVRFVYLNFYYQRERET